jgi:hypothetical protein
MKSFLDVVQTLGLCVVVLRLERAISRVAEDPQALLRRQPDIDRVETWRGANYCR